VLEVLRTLAAQPASRALGGVVFAFERSLREKVEARTGRRHGARSIGRVLYRLAARGVIGHQWIRSGQMLGPNRTTCGGQHNWIITREVKRKSRKLARERERQARHRMQRANERREEAEAEARRAAAKRPVVSYPALLADAQIDTPAQLAATIADRERDRAAQLDALARAESREVAIEDSRRWQLEALRDLDDDPPDR